MNNKSQVRGFVFNAKRIEKAKKIESVLKDFLKSDEIAGYTILDVGTGGGQIADYFSRTNLVYGVDIQNQLQIPNPNKINFQKLNSSLLPFPENYFDIALTNHVIEHLCDQNFHLNEIYRVLKPKGICYLATPNRNFPIEPHYKIPFVHYLPPAAFNFILHVGGMFKEELFLLSYREMWSLFNKQQFEVAEYTSNILKHPEKFYLNVLFTKHIPLPILNVLRLISPTNIFILRKIS